MNRREFLQTLGITIAVAALPTPFKPIAKEVAAAPEIASIPTGTIIAATHIPDGWLLCDGAAISVKAYPQLFEVLEHTYSEGWDGKSEKFQIPDLRGHFMRDDHPLALERTEENLPKNIVVKYVIKT